MITRFGNDRAGRLARTTYAVMAVITLASFIGYAFEGIGKFAAVYIPLDPNLLAVLIVLITTLYVLLGGLYGVVFTHIIQAVILLLAGTVIAAVAYREISPDLLQRHLLGLGLPYAGLANHLVFRDRGRSIRVLWGAGHGVGAQRTASQCGRPGPDVRLSKFSRGP